MRTQVSKARQRRAQALWRASQGTSVLALNALGGVNLAPLAA